MPDVLAATLSLPGIGWVLVAAMVAGLVYGFAGFGAALIFMPVAAAQIGPVEAVTLGAAMGLGSLVTLLPGALKLASWRETGILLVASLLGLPVGVWVLSVVDPVVMAWAISGVVALTLVAMVTGWRRKTKDGLWAMLGVGAASGVLGGATALTGPVIVVFKLSGQGSVAEVRASMLAFITLLSVFLLPALWFRGILRPEVFWSGVLLMPVYMIGTLVGKAVFAPQREELYRWVAYGLIALALVTSVAI